MHLFFLVKIYILVLYIYIYTYIIYAHINRARSSNEKKNLQETQLPPKLHLGPGDTKDQSIETISVLDKGSMTDVHASVGRRIFLQSCGVSSCFFGFLGCCVLGCFASFESG